MRYVVIVGLALTLGGCGIGTSFIKSDAVDFSDVIEDTTNKLLVINLLRARDKAPLHFADIPVLRESIQESVSLQVLNLWGARNASSQRRTQTGTASLQFTPSFEITHLHSKDFNTGISSPIDPKIVKYWLDRGLDPRIVLLLFFSAAEIVDASGNDRMASIRIANSPREAIEVIKRRDYALDDARLRCDGQSDFERYLKLLNSLENFFANSYRERRALATGLKMQDEKALQSYAAMDQSKVQLVYDRGTSAYNLYALSPETKVAFCFYEADQSRRPEAAEFGMAGAGGAAPAERTGCYQSLVDLPPEDSKSKPLLERPLRFPGPAARTNPSQYCSIYNQFVRIDGPRSDKLRIRLHIRSVGEIFQFLGDLLHYQDELKKLHAAGRSARMNSPVTFGYCQDQRTPGCDDIFIRLDADPCNVRFTVPYRDQQYRVANFNPPAAVHECRGEEAQQMDHTLEILSVLHQLVGLNKSGADLRATPAVQVLP